MTQEERIQNIEARCPWVPSMLDFFADDWVAQY